MGKQENFKQAEQTLMNLLDEVFFENRDLRMEEVDQLCNAYRDWRSFIAEEAVENISKFIDVKRKAMKFAFRLIYHEDGVRIPNGLLDILLQKVDDGCFDLVEGRN